MDKSNNLPKKIPVFPLSNFIVFPNTTVPLNIFEPRYLKMTEDAMSNNRLIGMIQPKKTGKIETPDLFDVGCVCRIVSFNETDDGRYIIVLSGISRFKIVEEIQSDKLYRKRKNYSTSCQNFSFKKNKRSTRDVFRKKICWKNCSRNTLNFKVR